jgi:hypothetical protein
LATVSKLNTSLLLWIFLESGGEELEDSMNGPVSVSMGSGAGLRSPYMMKLLKQLVEQGSASASMLQRAG